MLANPHQSLKQAEDPRARTLRGHTTRYPNARKGTTRLPVKLTTVEEIAFECRSAEAYVAIQVGVLYTIPLLHYRISNPYSHLKQLSFLDLTACVFEEFSIEALVDLPNLSTLILFNIWPLEEQLHIVCKLRSLMALDISTAFGTTGNGSYNDPNKVTNWKNVSLDRLYDRNTFLV